MIKETMLVVISDLHLSDGTATNNLSPRAFKHFHNLIKRAIRENTKEIIIVFAGDTFDLLRSEYWMTVQDDEKPWATDNNIDKNKIKTHLMNIFKNILDVNSESIDIIRQTDKFFYPIPVHRILILGNHDRMLGDLDGFPDILSEAIGDIHIEKEGYKNIEYGVAVRHGHQYDEYNFEPDGIPIGDVSTTELFVRLPFEIKQEFPLLEDELKSIEDIRPQWRIFDYLSSAYQKNKIKPYIEKAVDRTVESFLSIPFVKHWIKKHDTILHPLDIADRFKYMLYLSKFISIERAERFLKVFSYFEINEPRYEEMAASYDSLYTVFGHTHSERISFLSENNGLHRYYINTGTWRERIIASKDGNFSRYKSMTYATFYKKEERGTDFPSFELWNGALRE
ncbi:MAG: metallophosphoesterase [Syntrophorhabdaceae bacterium]|nr:metallophosphoesterase [Syntrophorhabdales bacterium]MBP9560626.1 metallophosphoesterase [Syntrophorhabdaceae bacterium]